MDGAATALLEGTDGVLLPRVERSREGYPWSEQDLRGVSLFS